MQPFRFGSSAAIGLFSATLLSLASSADAAFQSAVITLSFPPGARATGLGEAFTGLADDANATYYNPAGLGQAPLANSWKSYLAESSSGYYAIATKRKREFSLREKIWVGTPQGVLRYNGKAWEDFETYLIEEDDRDLFDIAATYITTEDDATIARAVQKLREKNNVEMKRYRGLKDLFRSSIPASERDSIPVDLAASVLDLPPEDRDSLEIFDKLVSYLDSAKAADLAGKASSFLVATPDRQFDRLVDVKIPFSLAVTDSITAIHVDATENVWIGTPNGLWRFDGPSWLKYTILDGLPSDFVTSIAEGPRGEIAVGTDHGFAVYSEAQWSTYDMEDSQITDAYINCLVVDENEAYFLGTHQGLLKKEGNTWTVFDTASGLVSREVTALMIDSKKRLWVGGHNGLALKDQTTWKRYKFPESVVHSIEWYDEERVWIGTDKGAITYTEGDTKLGDDGKVYQEAPEWKAFHSKNALVGNTVHDIAVHGNDVWLVTEKGINRYDNAEKEVLFFWELLLPALKIRDLYHSYLTYVHPTEDWGTFAALVNFLYFGENDLTDEEGRITEQFTSWEGVFGLSWGLGLKQDLSMGLSVKYVISALVPTLGADGIGQSFAFDAALLKRNFLTPKLDLGVNLQNMGKPIFYGNTDNPDPLPFTVRLGLAYRAIETPAHDLTLLFDLSRELAGKKQGEELKGFWDAIYYDLAMDDYLKNDSTLTDSERRRRKIRSELSEVQLNAGIEWWYVNFLALRTGFLFDYIGERYELTFGLGIKYGTLAFDFSLIHSPEGFLKGFFEEVIEDTEDTHREGSHGVRHGQPRFSLIFRF